MPSSLLGRACALVPLLVVAGCAPSEPGEVRDSVVQAIFDPSQARLPSPNDLAMKDGVVAISENKLLAAPENELKLSFNGRSGFSASSTAKVSFTGALNAATLDTSTVYGLDLGLGGGGPVTRLELTPAYNACDTSVDVFPKGGFLQGHTYLFAVRGGETGVQGLHGERVAPSPIFHFLRAGKDLREHPSAFPGATRAEREATAQKLETVRQTFEPFFLELEKLGLPRQETAALWHFTIQTEPEARMDPAAKKLPMPFDLLRNPETGMVTLPADPADSAQAKALKEGLNQLDGFSLTGAITLEASEPLDPSSLVAGQTLRVFETATLTELTAFDTAVALEDPKLLVVRPRVPLRGATNYTVVVTKVRDSRGRPLLAAPLATLLKLRGSLLGERGTQISSVCTETASKLEKLRGKMAPVLDVLEEKGVAREDIAAAFSFTTQDINARLEQLFHAPYDAGLPLQVTKTERKSPDAWGLQAIMTPFISPVAEVVRGKMTTLDFLDPVTRAFRTDGQAEPREIDFLLTIPDNLKTGQKFPVVVLGHALMTERRMGLFLAQSLAERGFGTFTFDFPYHGERSACLSNAHCDSGSLCGKNGRCQMPNGTPADFDRRDDIVGFNLPWPMGAGTPTASGEAFIDIENLFAVRDHMRQAMVDMSAATRLLRHMDWKPVTGGFPIDGEALVYSGVSLGGIVGANLAAMDPHYKAMLLSVAGAGLPEIMRDSDFFGPRLREGLTAKGVLEGTMEHFRFVNAAHWVVDEVDPVNLARMATVYPRRYMSPDTGQQMTLSAKKVRMHMANGDAIIPNSSTLRLVDAFELNRDTQFRAFTSLHGAIYSPTNQTERLDQADFLEASR